MTGEHDVLDAIMRLQSALQDNGFAPLEAVELGSHADGARFVAYFVDRYRLTAKRADPTMSDDEAGEIRVMGLKIRYPQRVPSLSDE